MTFRGRSHLIPAAGIVPGNLFGILGMLLSIPAAANPSFIYHGCLLPHREKRRAAETVQDNGKSPA